MSYSPIFSFKLFIPDLHQESSLYTIETFHNVTQFRIIGIKILGNIFWKFMHGYMWIVFTDSSGFWDMINNALVSLSCRLNGFNRHLIWIIYAKQTWNFLRDSLKWSNAQGPFKAKYYADHIWIVMKGSKQVMRNTNLHITDLLFFIWVMHIRNDFPFYLSFNGHNQY